MAQGGLLAVYDFIYKNRSAIASFYAQMFDGLLEKRTVSNETNTSESTSKSAGYSATHYKSVNTETAKKALMEEIDPNEIITIDAVNELLRSYKSPDEAGDGDIIKFDADIFFLDKALFDTMIPNVADFIAISASGKDKRKIKKEADMMKRMFASLRFDPLVFAKMPNGKMMIGSIKEENLSESIASFHIRYGSGGMRGVTLVGIMDGRNDPDIFAYEDTLLGAATQMLAGIEAAVIPADAISFTPVAIYREINLGK